MLLTEILGRRRLGTGAGFEKLKWLAIQKIISSLQGSFLFLCYCCINHTSPFSVLGGGAEAQLMTAGRWYQETAGMKGFHNLSSPCSLRLWCVCVFWNSWSNTVPLGNAPVRSKILCCSLLVIAGSPWKHCPHETECFFHSQEEAGLQLIYAVLLNSSLYGWQRYLSEGLEWGSVAKWGWQCRTTLLSDHCASILIEIIACGVLRTFPDEVFIEQEMCSCCSIIVHDLRIFPSLYHAVSN